MPLKTFSNAAKAKRSKNPNIIKLAEEAELISFFIFFPIIIALTIGIGSWLFSGTIFAIIPIIIIILIIIKIKKLKNDK